MVVVTPTGTRYHEISTNNGNIETECGLTTDAESARFVGPEKQAKNKLFEKCAKCSEPDRIPSVY